MDRLEEQMEESYKLKVIREQQKTVVQKHHARPESSNRIAGRLRSAQ